MKLLLFVCLLPGLCRAQDAPINYARKSVWRVLFLSPGVTNESRLGPNTTIVTTATLGSYFGGQSTITGPNTTRFDSYYGVYATLSAGGRYFYNFARRIERGKSVRYNSANYLSVMASYSTPAFIRKDPVRPWEADPTVDGPSAQVLWGFQRTYRRNFYLNLGLGAGVSRRNAGFAGDFAIGYTFSNPN